MKFLKNILLISIIAPAFIATPAEACRFSRGVDIFEQKPVSEVPKDMMQIKVSFDKVERKELPGAPINFTAKIIEGDRITGETITITAPLSGNCHYVAQPKQGKEAWITGKFIKYSNGSDLYIDNVRVFEAKGRFK